MYFKKFFKSQFLTNLIFVSIIILFSSSINSFFGHKGLMPLDDLQNFNSGYRVLNGDFPFRDYYSISGPFLDIFQSFFYKIFGVNWDSFILHSSFFNCLYSISIFIFLKSFNFSNKLALLYSLCSGLLMSPTAGNPTVEHHSLILGTISLILFIISSKEKNNILFFLVPIILLISFFIKQVPTAYFIILISIIYFLQIFRKTKIMDILLILLIGIICLFLILFFFQKNGAHIKIIIEQYILIAASLGENRISQINFESLFEVFKKLLFLFVCIIPLLINYLKTKNYDFLITSFGLFIIILFYELHSMNQLITFSLLPIFIFFAHRKILEIKTNKFLTVFFMIIIIYSFYRILRFEIYYIFAFLFFLIFIFVIKYKNKFKVEYLVITYLLISTSLYFEKYIKLRQWDDISFDKKKIFKGEEIDEKFKNLDWQTVYFDNSNQEKKFLLKMKKFLDKQKQSNYLYITDYQLFNVILGRKDFSPVKYWHYNTSFPGKTHPYRENFENFFKIKLKENNVELIISDGTAISSKKIYEFTWIKNCLVQKENKKIEDKNIVILKINLDCI